MHIPLVNKRTRAKIQEMKLLFISLDHKPFAKNIEPPHLNWSSAMFRKRRTDNDEQTTEAGRDYHEVEAS